MPWGRPYLDTPGIFVDGTEVLRRFQAYVLHRVRINFGTDQRFDRIEKSLVTQQVENLRSHPHRCIRLHILLGQRKIEILRMHLARFSINFRQSIAKRQVIIRRRYLALSI